MQTLLKRVQVTAAKPCLMIAVLGLAACDAGVSQITGASQSLNAIAGVQSAAQAQPTQDDLALSCAAIGSELDGLYAKLEAIDKEQRAIQRNRNLQNGAINTGISILGVGALGNAGSVSGIRNTSAAIGAANTIANSAQANGSVGDSRALNEALAIQQRAAVLERTKVSKRC